MREGQFKLYRRLRAARRRLRELRMIARALLSTAHPVLAHLIVTRRCNLSCAYCNEYDTTSKPVPLAALVRRIERLHELGTSIITMSGGEPLLNPALESAVAHCRKLGIIAGMITNGYLLTAERIRQLNDAGLDHLQISIDNAIPDAVSKKSLKVLDRKLELLAAHALFHVNINTVLGAAAEDAGDAIIIARRAAELGFTSTVGILHGAGGQGAALGAAHGAAYRELSHIGRAGYARFNVFQRRVIEGSEQNWRCRAGARYLYICEDGLVHYCSQQRGYPAKPLDQYTAADLRREFSTPKTCAPACTISCVHQVALLDFWRGPQAVPSGEPASDLVNISLGSGAGAA